jgi:hypothetical protein
MYKNNNANVIDITTFSRRRFIRLPESVKKPNGKYDSFKLSENQFGFAEGDEIICLTNFDAAQIKPNTLVISQSSTDQILTTAAAADEILAIVVAFTREVVE